MMLELEGHAIEHYHILRRLAHGGMSDIYLGQDTHTGNAVVIKMVHNSNHEYSERFRSEAQTASILHHDHILPSFTYGKDATWSYMVFPYIEGGTLHDRLAQGPLSLHETGTILTQLVSALQFAHDHGIIHRDLKPSNILLQNREHVYLADFGLAQRIDEDDGLTATEYLIGTPEYMAPELAEEKATIQSDIYALGVILYQLLTGHVPFKGSTPIGTYLKHIREQPVSPTTLNPSIPEEVSEVILCALEKKPEHRYSSARDLARAYQHAVTQSSYRISRRNTSSAFPALATVPAMQAELVSKETSPHWSQLSLIVLFCFVLLPTTLGAVCYQFNALRLHSINRSVTIPTRLQKIESGLPDLLSGSITTIMVTPPHHAIRVTPQRQAPPPQSTLIQRPSHDRDDLDNKRRGDRSHQHTHRRQKH